MSLITVFYPKACGNLPYTKAIIPETALKTFLDLGFAQLPPDPSKKKPAKKTMAAKSPDLELSNHEKALEKISKNTGIAEYVFGFTGKEINWRGARKNVIKRAIATIKEYLTNGNG